MREGIDCKGRKWIERELKKNENEEKQPIRLIEFDGPQHKQSSEHFGGEESFQRLQNHDNLKNQYAFNHNIPLVRIPYKERDNITLELLLGDKYLLHSPS